ncbi:hypothetical protein QTI51_37415 [Variovorax sp. J22G73]|uniref:hypothetical protein n=1 Tax=unclassified Variovorax TaxID=663243 RepID=UPI00257900C0|nr:MULTISPECIES: hypothetical protein [unclassified Variovorax]MDM0010133.1 hypothetical protein [Variovorax sp. J22R203]MDM0103005.1 hypothetical protein [Variovorax sp. J22G73]
MAALDGEEVLVRALPNMLWDEVEARALSHAFTQKEISVSRLEVLSFESIVELFQLDVAKPGEKIEHAGLISVNDLTDTVHGHESNRGVAVEDDPVVNDPVLHDNPSHALIKAFSDIRRETPKEFSKGLARAIVKRLQYRATA